MRGTYSPYTRVEGMTTLRSKLIRLASVSNPERRRVLLSVLASTREAMEHATPEAMAKYLKEHPGADKSQHKVKKQEGLDADHDAQAKHHREQAEHHRKKVKQGPGDSSEADLVHGDASYAHLDAAEAHEAHAKWIRGEGKGTDATKIDELSDTAERLSDKAHRSKSGTRVASIGVGDTVELPQSMLRVHRFRDSIRVTDLTNAGKRGKRCDELWVSWWRGDTGEIEHAVTEWLDAAAHVPGFGILQDKIMAGLEALKSKSGGSYLESGVNHLRGVDVMPLGFAPVRIHGKHVHVEAGHDDFVIRDLDDQYNLPTCIAQGKKSIPVVYRWVSDNRYQIADMTFRQVCEGLDAAGASYRTYCAMD